MASPIDKRSSIIGIEEEVTQGVYLAPQATTSYIQPLADGFSSSATAESIDRQILTASPGLPTPRRGIESASVTLPVEWRGSGVEGGEVDYHPMLKSLLGTSRQITTQTTTKTGNTATVLQIQDADISKFNIGDAIVVLESGAHEARPIVAVDPTGGAANITLGFALTNGAPSDNVVLSKTTTAFTASSGHPSLSVSYYWANTIRESFGGVIMNSMSLDGFEPGGLASLNFAGEGLNFDEVDGAAPHTPVYDQETPPVILNACVYQDGVDLQLSAFSMNFTNNLSFQTNTCSASGKTGSRVVTRTLEGAMNPIKDDTDVSQFTKFKNNTEYSIFLYAYNPSGVAGEMDLGSVVTIYLPQVVTTAKPVADVDGLLVDDIAFKASRGADGTQEEIYMGFI